MNFFEAVAALAQDKPVRLKSWNKDSVLRTVREPRKVDGIDMPEVSIVLFHGISPHNGNFSDSKYSFNLAHIRATDWELGAPL